MFGLLLSVPLITGIIAVDIFMWSLYGIRYNRCGAKSKGSANKYIPIVGSLGTCQRLISGIQVMEKSSSEGVTW